MSGQESLFALDGQHRLMGIKAALGRQPDLADELISVLFVGHQRDEDGMMRTRRLFTTLNRYAKPVSPLEKIAMDEDDISAIVTRRIIDDYPLFRDATALVKGKQISADDRQNVTSVVALYDAVDLFLRDLPPNSWSSYRRIRPSDVEVERGYRRLIRLFDSMCVHFRPFREIRDGRPKQEVVRENRGRETGGHLLFRPIGLELVVQVVKDLIGVGPSLAAAVQRVAKVPMNLSSPPWAGLLWDVTNRRINYREEHRRVARRVMFYAAGGDVSAYGKDVSIGSVQRELTGILYPDDPHAPQVELARFAEAL